MKRQFLGRLLSLFLVGTVVAGVGCKDYDDDITSLNNRIDELTTGQIASVEKQMQSLQNAVDRLDGVDSGLKDEIEALQGKAETQAGEIGKLQEELGKAASASEVEALKKQIETLESDKGKLEKRIEALESARTSLQDEIDAVKGSLANYLTKSDAEATYATKTTVESLSQLLNQIKANYVSAEGLASTLEGYVTDAELADYPTLTVLQEAIRQSETAMKNSLGEAMEPILAKYNFVQKDVLDLEIQDLQEQIDALNGKPDADGSLANIKSRLEALENAEIKYDESNAAFTKGVEDCIGKALANDGAIDQAIANAIKDVAGEYEGTMQDLKNLIDGLRMDAISRMIYWQGDPARGVNGNAVSFLQTMNAGLRRLHPTAMLIAEDSTNFPKVTAPVEYGGLGFDYKWDMGWMHDTLDYFATPFGERPGCYGKLLFSMHYFYNELYLLALSHDEVVHGKKTIIDKLWGSYAEKCAQLRTLYFYMYTHPGKKLNFMGNELAHFREWDEKRELDWNLLEYPFHDAFQKYFAALSRTYASEPALYDGEYNPDCFEWVANESCAEGVYAWLRKGRGQNLLCVMNTQDHAHKKFPLYLKFPCSAELVLDTEAGTWGGVHKAHRKQSFHTTDGGVFGRDYTLTLDLPAMGSYLLRLSPEAPNPDAARLSANKALAQKRKAAKAAKAAAEVSDK